MRDNIDIQTMRHSCSHLLAAAVSNLYPDTKFGVGPAIENGFYYDFDLPKPISEEELTKIEEEMKRIQKEHLSFEHTEMPVEDAISQMEEKQQPYKAELIKLIQETGDTLIEDKAGEKMEVEKMSPVEEVSFYTLGNFTDLCKGPHVSDSSQIGPFKLLSIAGAYWRGSEKNKQLTRIYGTCFTTQQELDDYLHMLEEAKKRDHRKLGPQLGLFFFDETAPGMPYWLDKGMVVINELVSFWRTEHYQRGYQEIKSPLINKKELYLISGHWDHYRENMFISETEEGDTYALKPMNCPNAMIVYRSKVRSYKDLPLRLGDTDTLHRYEKSGTLNGLLRAREFSQDDAHIFVSEDQIEKEYKRILDIVEKFYSIFQLDYSFRLGTRPVDFMGDPKLWEKAETALKTILTDSGKKYFIEEGDGAFYGPKIDILMKDSLDRDWQMGTIQLDFQIPRQFGLKYIDDKGQEQTPAAIHRVIYGSFERFIGILIEHFAGAFPVWLSPVQVQIIPITERNNNYAQKVLEQLVSQNIRVEIDQRAETMQAKIRDAQIQKIPYMLIVGDREESSDKVAVRTREGKDMGAIDLSDFSALIKDKIATKALL